MHAHIYGFLNGCGRFPEKGSLWSLKSALTCVNAQEKCAEFAAKHVHGLVILATFYVNQRIESLSELVCIKPGQGNQKESKNDSV
jgi:hypothetical protein